MRPSRARLASATAASVVGLAVAGLICRHRTRSGWKHGDPVPPSPTLLPAPPTRRSPGGVRGPRAASRGGAADGHGQWHAGHDLPAGSVADPRPTGRRPPTGPRHLVADLSAGQAATDAHATTRGDGCADHHPPAAADDHPAQRQADDDRPSATQHLLPPRPGPRLHRRRPAHRRRPCIGDPAQRVADPEQRGYASRRDGPRRCWTG